MGTLSDRMKMDMELKNFSIRTQETYLSRMRHFTMYYGVSPDNLGTEEIRNYLYYLKKDMEASQTVIVQTYSALKFFYQTTLGRPWDTIQIPRSKQARKLPIVFSKQEIQSLFEATRKLKYLAMFMTVYGGGLRITEAIQLKVSDIDSDRMLIRIDNGKGMKDRYTLLGKQALEILRVYFNIFRPKDILFPGRDLDKPISASSVQRTYQKSLRIAEIRKPATVHTLRHSFATHLLESGADIHYIQRLLGHRSPATTMIYLHVAEKKLSNIKSPIDLLDESDKSTD